MINSPDKTQGCYIAFEGGEGCGKSTAIQAVRGLLGECLVTREPGGTRLAEKVRHVLQVDDGCTISPHSEFALFWAARFSVTEELIVPQLKAGKVVLSDRCAASTWAYQIHGRQMPELGDLFWASWNLLPRTPDMYLYLDLDPQEGLRRIYSGRLDEISRIDREELPFHQRVRAGYEDFFARVPRGKVVRIDASQSREAVAEAAIAAVREFRRAPT